MIKSIIQNKHCPRCKSIMYLGKRDYKEYVRFYYLCSNSECKYKEIEYIKNKEQE